MKLICSNCSNPEQPEFRNFELDDNILTCQTCGRKLKITHDLEKSNDWVYKLYLKNIKGNHRFDNDYIYQVINSGRIKD